MTIRRYVMIVALAGVLAAGALQAGAQESSYMLAGDSQGLWVVQRHPGDKTFDIIAKPSGGKWTWIDKSLTGQPAALAASGGILSVFFDAQSSQPAATDCLYYSFDNHEGTPGARLAGNVVSACRLTSPVAGAGGGSGMNILAVTLRDQSMSVTRPASLPASMSIASAGQASQSGCLTLLASGPDKWQEVATLENVAVTASTKIYSTSLGGKIYILLHTGAAGGNRLLCHDAGKWQDITLPAELQSAEVFGLASLPQKLRLIIAYTGLADSKVSKPVGLAILQQSAQAHDGFVIQPVVYQGKQLALDPSAEMLFAPLGEQLMLLWPEGQDMKVASCAGDGMVISMDDLPVSKVVVPLNGQKILQNFFWVVLILIFVPMMLIRPSSPPRPFVLAEGLVVGNLLKRVLAGAIDLLPFYLVFVAVFFSQLPAMSNEELLVFISASQIPDSAAYGLALALSLYATYCTLMEMKYSATLGKMIFHLRVVGEGGKTPDMRAVFLRNIMKIAEIVPPSLPILLLVPVLNRNRQRLGDIIARTAVVDARKMAVVKPTQDQSDSQVPPARPTE
jgi:uncharacterized RDD family membrane protein YckC